MSILARLHRFFARSHRRFYSAILLILTLFSVSAHSQYVHTQGTRILDGNGNEIYFTGMNLGNWLLWEGYLMMGDFNYRTHTQFLNSLGSALGGMANAREFEHQWRLNYVNEHAIAELAGLGFNSVRVPFHYNMFWQNGQLSDHGFQYFDRLIEYCRTHGIYILLDMHAAPGYQNPGDHSDNMNSNSSQPRDSVKFWDGNNIQIASQVWRHIANRYKNEPMIWGYDLINEPVLPPGREYELLPSLIQLRNAIRSVDNNHIIVAEGGWWASQLQVLDWTDPATQAATGVTSRWDNNLVYETHHYVFGNAGALADMYTRDDITNRLNIPLILGEYGEDTNEIIRTATDWSINNIAGHFPWSFKKMSHDRTLWTVHPNNIYNQVKNFINNGGTPPAGAYQGMLDFARNNIANGSAGIQWHQGFYDAVKHNGATNPGGPGDGAITNGIYEIINVGSGKSLDVQDVSTSNGANVQLWTRTGANNQRWQITALGNNEYRIEAVHSGRALDVANVSAENGANIHLWSYGGGANQRWRIESVGDVYLILSVLSGKSLDLEGNSTADGANIQQWDYFGGGNQLWQLN